MTHDVGRAAWPVGALVATLAFVGWLVSRLSTVTAGETTLLSPEAAVDIVRENLPSDAGPEEAEWAVARIRDRVARHMRGEVAHRSLYAAFADEIPADDPSVPAAVRARAQAARAEKRAPMTLARLGATVEAARDAGLRVRSDHQYTLDVRRGFSWTGALWALAFGALLAVDVRLRRLAGPTWAALAGLACLSFAGLALQAVYGAQERALALDRHAVALGAGVAAGVAAGLGVARVQRFPPWSELGLMGITAVPIAVMGVERVIQKLGWVPTRDAIISWTVFGVEVQPLEPVKFLLVAALALSARRVSAELQARHGRGAVILAAVPGIVALVQVGFVAFWLNDYGTLVVVLPALGLAALLLTTSTRPLAVGLSLVTMFGGVVASSLVPWDLPFLPAKIRGRLLMFDSPWENLYDNLRQVATGLWAIAAGGMWGRPAERIDPGHMRAATSDLVFALFSEAFGVVGSGGALLAAVAVALGVFVPASRSSSRPTLVALAVAPAAVVLTQCFIQAAFALGWHPLTGIVYPLLSSGRSGWVTFSAGIAFAVTLTTFLPVDIPVASVRAGPRLAGALVTAVGVLLVGRLGWVGVVTRDGISQRVILSGTKDYPYAGGQVVVVRNPRLEELVERRPMADVLTVDGAVAATGPGGRRTYPQGAAMAPILGVWRVDVSPYAGSVEALVQAPAHESDRLVGYLTVACDEEPCGAQDPALRFQRSDAGPRPTPADRQAVVEIRTPDRSELLWLVDATAAQVEAWRARRTAAPPPIRLGLHNGLQQSLWRRLSAHLAEAGAPSMAGVVVMDARTGAFVAEVSAPSIAPDRVTAALVEAEDSEEWKHLEPITRHPLPPGSSFKPVVSVAAIEAGLEGRTFHCDGTAPYGLNDACQRGGSTRHHGVLGLREAHEKSCNAFFGQMALAVGRDRLAEVVHRLPYTRFEKDGYDRDFAQEGFGQYNNETTAAELVRFFAAIAMDGSVPVCRGAVLAPDAPACDPRTFTAPGVAALERALLENNAKTVYAAAIGHPEYRQGGKTGTAQQDLKKKRKLKMTEQALDGGGYRRLRNAPEHTWFGGYVTDGLATYAIVAVAPRSGGAGVSDALPLFRLAVDALAEQHMLSAPVSEPAATSGE